MDPVTAAIVAAVAALGAGMARSASDVGAQAVNDAYDGLKHVLKQKCGGEASKVAKAVADVEAHPDSAGRQAVLSEEVVAAGAHQDPAVLVAVQALREQLLQAGAAVHVAQYRAEATADRAAAAGQATNSLFITGDHATVNQPEPQRRPQQQTPRE